MVLTYKELGFKLVYLLDLFFQDKRADEFKLFFWVKKENESIKIDILFNWKIVENNNFINSSSGFILLGEKMFAQPYLTFTTARQLSLFISNYLKDIYVDTENYNPNLSIVNGVLFKSDNWKETLSNLIGHHLVKEFYSTQYSSYLNNVLINKSHNEKITKI